MRRNEWLYPPRRDQINKKKKNLLQVTVQQLLGSLLKSRESAHFKTNTRLNAITSAQRKKKKNLCLTEFQEFRTIFPGRDVL